VDDLTEIARGFGAKGLAYFYVEADGVRSPSARFFTPEQMSAIVAALEGRPGDLLLFVADKPPWWPTRWAGCAFTWRAGWACKPGRVSLPVVIDFPMFEYKPEEKRYDAMHNPVTRRIRRTSPCSQKAGRRPRRPAAPSTLGRGCAPISTTLS